MGPCQHLLFFRVQANVPVYCSTVNSFVSVAENQLLQLLYLAAQWCNISRTPTQKKFTLSLSSSSPQHISNATTCLTLPCLSTEGECLSLLDVFSCYCFSNSSIGRMVSCFVWIASHSFFLFFYFLLLPKVCRSDDFNTYPENQRQWGISVICQRCSLPITNRP